jgi:hypothetical protein
VIQNTASQYKHISCLTGARHIYSREVYGRVIAEEIFVFEGVPVDVEKKKKKSGRGERKNTGNFLLCPLLGMNSYPIR